MLSLFPSLFDYSAVAITVLRVVVAVIFITEGCKGLFTKDPPASSYQKFLFVLECIGGTLLFIGLFTQAAVLVLAVASVKKLYKDRTAFYVLLFFISLSFLFFGPGLWSIDYPL